MTIPETYFTVSEELRLFGISCLLGAVVGVAYDVLRVLRLMLPHNSFLVAAEDVGFLGDVHAADCEEGHQRGDDYERQKIFHVR